MLLSSSSSLELTLGAACGEGLEFSSQRPTAGYGWGWYHSFFCFLFFVKMGPTTTKDASTRPATKVRG